MIGALHRPPHGVRRLRPQRPVPADTHRAAAAAGAGRGGPAGPVGSWDPGPEAVAFVSPRPGLGLRSQLAGGGSRFKGWGRGRSPLGRGGAGRIETRLLSPLKGSFRPPPDTHSSTSRARRTESRAPVCCATSLPYDSGRVPVFRESKSKRILRPRVSNPDTYAYPEGDIKDSV